MEREQLDSIFLKNCKILEKIKVNSMFEVYKGVTEDNIKVILKIARDSNFLSVILENEYKKLQKLSLKEIPKVIKYGKNFLILEYKEGINLKEAKKKAILNWNEVRNIFLYLLNLVDELHKNGVIHGDIKPENIIYNSGEIYLIDFGSAIYTGEKKSIIHFTPNILEQKKCKIEIASEKYDYYCIFKTFLYLIRGDYKEEYKNLPNTLENFIRFGLDGKFSNAEEILKFWDIFKL